jgi:uncharacterized membrane protein YczE
VIGMTAATADSVRNPPRQIESAVRILVLNLVLTAVIAVLFAVFHDALLDYQLQHLGTAPADGARAGLSIGLWSRVGSVVIIAIVSTVLIRGLRAGRRRSYVRVLAISVFGLLSSGYLVWTGQYPLWVDAAQLLQAALLVALLWTITRPDARDWFSSRRRP